MPSSGRGAASCAATGGASATTRSARSRERHQHLLLIRAILHSSSCTACDFIAARTGRRERSGASAFFRRQPLFLWKPDRNLCLAKPFHHFCGRLAVGEERIDLLEGSQTHQGVTAELRVVGNEKDRARVFDDGLRDPDLAIIEIEKRTVGIDAADADDPDVDLEQKNQVDCGLPDNAADASSDQATSYNDLVTTYDSR